MGWVRKGSLENTSFKIEDRDFYFCEPIIVEDKRLVLRFFNQLKIFGATLVTTVTEVLIEGCSPICIHFWVVISKLITLAALLKFPVTLSLFWKLMNKDLIQALRENWVLWLFLCHMAGLGVGRTAVMSFPEPIKANRYLVPVACVGPWGGSYLSSSWRMGWWVCFAGGVYVSPGAVAQPSWGWGLAAWLLFVTTRDDKWFCLTQLQEPLHVYNTLCVGGSWSWSVPGARLSLKLEQKLFACFPCSARLFFSEIPAVGDQVKLQSRKDGGRISQSQGCQTRWHQKAVKIYKCMTNSSRNRMLDLLGY